MEHFANHSVPAGNSGFSSQDATQDGGARPPPSLQSGAKRSWTINGDFVMLKQTGVARYAREVTGALDALVGEGHPLTRELEIDCVAPRALTLASIPVRVVPEFRAPRLPQFWVQAQLPRRLKGGLLSFCNLGPVAPRRHIVCIHDLHTMLMPESYGFAFRTAHRLLLPALGRRAAMITTVSELSRGHLIEHGVAKPEKISVTYNGGDHAHRWNAGRALLDLSGPRPFVLCLGRPQTYKNGELFWRIAERLDALGIDILMAGDVDAATLKSFGPEQPRNVRLLGRVSDDGFAYALSKALCFAFPSRIEGFGLPAVEAMALGCPLIASTSPCLPEICGDAALYAGPDDPAAWVDAIARIRSQPTLAADLVRRGQARAQRYSWRKIAELYLELMAKVDRTHG